VKAREQIAALRAEYFARLDAYDDACARLRTTFRPPAADSEPPEARESGDYEAAPASHAALG